MKIYFDFDFNQMVPMANSLNSNAMQHYATSHLDPNCNITTNMTRDTDNKTSLDKHNTTRPFCPNANKELQPCNISYMYIQHRHL